MSFAPNLFSSLLIVSHCACDFPGDITLEIRLEALTFNHIPCSLSDFPGLRPVNSHRLQKCYAIEAERSTLEGGGLKMADSEEDALDVQDGGMLCFDLRASDEKHISPARD
jgi:hypothetical protein